MISNKYDIMKVCFKANLHVHDFYVSQLNILKTIDGHQNVVIISVKYDIMKVHFKTYLHMIFMFLN